jgi:cytosine/adenosine deaminase-related metal-dependent hydrolase
VTRPQATVLRARYLLPGHGPAIENGWVSIVGGRIAGIGSGRPGTAAIDLGDAVILPGLVNAHTHLEFSTLDRPFDATGGPPAWIRRVVGWRRERDAADDAAAEKAAAIHAGLRESAASGVTTVGEIATGPASPASVPSAAALPRLRVFREVLGLSAATIDAAARGLVRDLDRLSAAGVAAGISPHAPYSVAAPLAARLAREIRGRRLPVAMHLAESLEEAELLATGGGPLRRLLEDLGAWRADAPPRLVSVADWITRLARAARGIVVHGTHLPADADALARLARHRDRLCVAVCPRTTRALSGSLPPVAAFRAAGVSVALGTDGRGSNPDLSILAECRTLVDAGLASPAEAIAMATVHGAWALALERVAGRLIPGRPADLVILRPANAHAAPHDAALDPATTIVATLRAGRIIAGGIETKVA